MPPNLRLHYIFHFVTHSFIKESSSVCFLFMFLMFQRKGAGSTSENRQLDAKVNFTLFFLFWSHLSMFKLTKLHICSDSEALSSKSRSCEKEPPEEKGNVIFQTRKISISSTFSLHYFFPLCFPFVLQCMPTKVNVSFFLSLSISIYRLMCNS